MYTTLYMEKKKNKKRNTTDKTEKPTPKPKTEKPKPSKEKEPQEPTIKRIVDSITVCLI